MTVDNQSVYITKKIIICIFVTLTTVLMVLIGYTNTFSGRIGLRNYISNSPDYKHLISINFTFKMLPLVCQNKELLLLILVHSSTNNFLKRQVIRETWGQNEDDIKILFLVGITEQHPIQKKLEDESRQYNDLVQGSFIDTYHNLTYKHVMALKYALYHCPKVQYVLKVDDDVFVNTPNMKKFIQAYKCQNMAPRKIFCVRLFNPPVLREGKWMTSLKDYAKTNYPTHCTGFVILYSYEVVQSLYAEAQKTKFFWVDDVQITGIVAKNVGIGHIGIERLILSNEELRNITESKTDDITKPFLFGRMNLDEREIRSLWDFIVKHPQRAGILDYLNY